MPRRRRTVQSMAEMRRRLRGPADTLAFLGPLNDHAIEEPLSAIEAIQKLRAALDDAEALAVTVARADRFTWDEISDRLGSPKASVHRKFRHLDLPRD